MNGKRGTTLVTVMVSVAILGITLAAATSAFIGAAKLTKHAGCVSAASNFAEGVMERVSAQPYASIQSANVRTALPRLPEAACSVAVTKREAGLKEVTVTCSWVEAGSPFRVQFATLAAEGGPR